MKRKFGPLLMALALFVSAFAVTSFAKNLYSANNLTPCEECAAKDNNGCPLTGCTYYLVSPGKWLVACHYKANCGGGPSTEEPPAN